MPLYLQHGAQKSDYIQRAAEAGLLDGIVLSPRDERPDRMIGLIDSIRNQCQDTRILFDPQFYATILPERNDRYLPDYEQYYRYPLRRANFSARDMQRYCGDSVKFQFELGVDTVIAPSVHFAHFNDPWSQIALNMSQEASVLKSSGGSGTPMLASIIVEERALCDSDSLNEYLDAITALDVDGFYIVVQCAGDRYPAAWDAVALCNFLYMVYILSEVNQYFVLCGYSDFVGVVATAAGASAIATGWFNSLRQFSLGRVMPSTGGRRGRPRYSTDALMNAILVVPELSTIREMSMLSDVVVESGFDDVLLSPSFDVDEWNQGRSFLHHWAVIKRLLIQIQDGESVALRCAAMEGILDQADALYVKLMGNGISFEPASGAAALRVWREAFAQFRNKVDI